MRIYTTLFRLDQYTDADGVNFPNPQDRFLAFLHANAFFPNRVTFLAGMCQKLGMDSIGIFLYRLFLSHWGTPQWESSSTSCVAKLLICCHTKSSTREYPVRFLLQPYPSSKAEAELTFQFHRMGQGYLLQNLFHQCKLLPGQLRFQALDVL